jgi:hypothetical protein
VNDIYICRFDIDYPSKRRPVKVQRWQNLMWIELDYFKDPNEPQMIDPVDIIRKYSKSIWGTDDEPTQLSRDTACALECKYLTGLDNSVKFSTYYASIEKDNQPKSKPNHILENLLKRRELPLHINTPKPKRSKTVKDFEDGIRQYLVRLRSAQPSGFDITAEEMYNSFKHEFPHYPCPPTQTSFTRNVNKLCQQIGFVHKKTLRDKKAGYLFPSTQL